MNLTLDDITISGNFSAITSSNTFCPIFCLFYLLLERKLNVYKSWWPYFILYIYLFCNYLYLQPIQSVSHLLLATKHIWSRKSMWGLFKLRPWNPAACQEVEEGCPSMLSLCLPCRLPSGTKHRLSRPLCPGSPAWALCNPQRD